MSARVSAIEEAQLFKLSDRVELLSRQLAKISISLIEAENSSRESYSPEVPLDVLKTIIRFRHKRNHHWPDELFFDPAWDMMLDLLRAEVTCERVSVTSVCLASGVPQSTALRWLRKLVQNG